jgi:predicted 3-demethylubiquinone-9 3-methyltransferase (glyoxalase superfamily)
MGGEDGGSTEDHPCLWFDSEAEEAARFYVSVFRNARVGKISRYGKEGFEIHGRPEGSVMTVEFEIEGQSFTALNGGPHFKFNEAISFQLPCGTQEEIDHYWEKLSAGGEIQQCGWLKTSSVSRGRFSPPPCRTC